VGSQQLSRKRQLSLLKNNRKNYSKTQKQAKNEEIYEGNFKGGANKEEEDVTDCDSDEEESTLTESKPILSDSKPAKQFHGYYKKEIYHANASYFNMVFQLRIKTKQGVRLEYVPVTLPFAISSSLMQGMTMEYPSFCSHDMPCFSHIVPKARLLVVGWDSDFCSIDLSNLRPILSTHHLYNNDTVRTISGEVEQNDFSGCDEGYFAKNDDVVASETPKDFDEDSDCSSSKSDSGDEEWNRLLLDSSDDDDTFKPRNKRKKNIPLFENDDTTIVTAAANIVTTMPFSSSAFIEPGGQPKEIEDDSSIVTVGLWMTDKTPDNILSINIEIFPPANLILPHPKKNVCIQNACGSCTTPYQLNLSCFKYLSKKKKKFSACESLSTVTATFVLCSNRCRVDFRGVRSIEAMSRDWKLVSGLDISEVSTSIYLLVMKGCIGRSLMLTSETCFLANATATWCTSSLHFDDLCDILELRDINWDKIFAGPFDSASDATKRAKTQVNISRRGGAVIRMVFPKDTPWDISNEQNVLSDCDRLFDLLNDILAGKVLDVSERHKTSHFLLESSR
jgi:hypothetical protein